MNVRCGADAGLITITILAAASIPISPAQAFPIPVGFGAVFDSHDNSFTQKVGPYHLHLIQTDPKTGVKSEFDEDIGPGGSETFVDVKDKQGNAFLKTETGDPLGIFQGTISAGSGYIDLTTSGIPELFPSSRAILQFVSGSLSFAITLPGNQLTGPDGGSTFINYATTWNSDTPIGVTPDGASLSLGSFDLVSSLPLSSFFYTLDPANLSGTMTFTEGETFVFGDGTKYAGTVTKNLIFSSVPESGSVTLLSMAITCLLLVRRRLSAISGRQGRVRGG